MRNDGLRYGTVSRSLHWLIAILMIVAWLVGDQGEDLRGAEKSAILALHALPGLAVARALVAAGHDPSTIHFVGAERGPESELVPA